MAWRLLGTACWTNQANTEEGAGTDPCNLESLQTMTVDVSADSDDLHLPICCMVDQLFSCHTLIPKMMILLTQHIREFHRTTGCNTLTVKVGDIVLIHDDTPRVQWKLSVVEQVNKGTDGLIRSANVRTATGTTN